MTCIFTVTSIHSIQKNTRKSQKLGHKLPAFEDEDSGIKRERNRVDK